MGLRERALGHQGSLGFILFPCKRRRRLPTGSASSSEEGVDGALSPESQGSPERLTLSQWPEPRGSGQRSRGAAGEAERGPSLLQR